MLRLCLVAVLGGALLSHALPIDNAAPPPIPTPNAAQARYQDTDFVALIHFNMGTYAHNGDPCCDPTNWDVQAPYATGKTSNPATFDPKLLNTTQWMESITNLGANIAILTAKHGCGFALWPTKATIPDGTPEGTPYGYSVGTDGAAIKDDVLEMFVNSANEAGVGYGFYYSIMKNFKLCRSFSGTNSCMDTVLPGQYNLTDDDYKKVATEMVTELWTQYGNLTEIWVDSGLDGLGDLMIKLQPDAVGTPRSPTGWCGTESGHPSHDVGPQDVWSLGPGFHGDPNSSEWIPKFCDPQLFVDHVWFWEPNLAVRTLKDLIPIYHDIVGRGMVMELAFSIDRDGLVEDTHAAMYKKLGDWVRLCYGEPIAIITHAAGDLPGWFAVNSPFTWDRIQIQEDTSMGQRVRRYAVESSLDSGATWTTLVNGSAIGTKRIHLFDPVSPQPGQPQWLRLHILESVAEPRILSFAVFQPCPTE
mmetsp:Transcript_21178/g.46020  ORF Transcript_21178/g.46020 Transcript_21178/m.46020 type:complete len:474 (-) Transcript_21178:57-1478(-)